MIVLGIESSTPIASVAVVSEDKVLGEITLNIGLTHAEQLLPLIDELLRQTKLTCAELGGIAIAGGPGSFTGLRIGITIANVWGWFKKIKVNGKLISAQDFILPRYE